MLFNCLCLSITKLAMMKMNSYTSCRFDIFAFHFFIFYVLSTQDNPYKNTKKIIVVDKEEYHPWDYSMKYD